MNSMQGKKQNFKKYIVIGLVCVIVTLGGVVFSRVLNSRDAGLQLDSNVITGSMDNKTLSEKMDEAQKKVDEGMLAIDIAPNPIFEDSKSKGKVMIGNPSNNTKNFTVEFILEENNKSVYKSGLIPPNSYIEEVNLQSDLSKGDYPAIAYFTSYDESGNASGSVGVNINITVLN